METRDLYKQKYEAQLKEWGARIEALNAHADVLTAQAKIDMQSRHGSLADKLAAAKAKLQEVADATDDKWDDVRKTADDAWSEMTAAVEGAYNAIKPSDKS
jgi:uncharacterized coiled-coil DUF342 family protein